MKKDRFIYYEQLWTLLADLRVGVFTVDRDRRITSFNRAAELLTGYQERDVLGRRCHAIFLNDLCLGECKYHEAVEAEQKSLSFDVEITDAQGERRLVTKIVTPLHDGNQRLIGCMEIFQDRTAFAELINRIRYDEQQLKLILNNLDIGIFTVSRGGLISFFNTAAEEISGYGRGDILGKPCSTILVEEQGGGAVPLERSIADGKPRSNSRGRLKTCQGTSIPIRGNYMALKNEQGKTVGGLATFQDLSLIDRLSREIEDRYVFADMVGRDPAMQKIFGIVPVIAASDATVLIEGATGTGKDLLAKVIHHAGKRSGKPLVKVNCAALPDNLLESEMFGYVRGAFTGADHDKPGRFQEAEGGTIFLDEIGDLPLALQAKLLRVLEDKEFYPLGSRKTTRVDVRIIAATNQGLDQLVAEKQFRQDLFYRLNVIRLELPPLRERRADLPLLIEHILKRQGAARGEANLEISEEALEVLLNYHYPGNIRELENILEHAAIICERGLVERRHLPLALQQTAVPPSEDVSDPGSGLPAARESSEKARILEALSRHGWHRGRTAEELRIDRTTLWRRMRKYRISPPARDRA